jgi:hypothetical protein
MLLLVAVAESDPVLGLGVLALGVARFAGHRSAVLPASPPGPGAEPGADASAEHTRKLP